MITVSVRELKRKTNKLIRRVREQGEKIQVTYLGEIVALILPVKTSPHSNLQDGWNQLDVLAAEIGASWTEGVTSVETVAEVRRGFDESHQDQ